MSFGEKHTRKFEVAEQYNSLSLSPPQSKERPPSCVSPLRTSSLPFHQLQQHSKVGYSICTVRSTLRPTMGIQGLLPLLKDIQTPVHVSSYAGKTLGIDAYVWLHRGAYGCAREIVLGDPTPRYIAHALSRIRMLQHFGVKPYLVFDGDKLPAKCGTEDDREQRRSQNLQRANELEQQGKVQHARDVYAKCVDITPEMAFQLIKVLKQQNIPYVVAPYEADAQLAYLEAERLIDGIITEDSDLLVFGCKTVLFKLDQAGNAVEMLQSRFWTNRHIALSGWTPVEFRQMAILSGCDYLPSIVGMGLKNAHRLLRRYKTVDKVLQAVRLEGKMRVPQTYAREFRKAELTFVHQRVYDPRSQKLVTLTPLPDGFEDELVPFIGAAMDEHVAKAIAEGWLDPISRTEIVDRTAKPLASRSSSVNNVMAASAAGGSGHGLHRSETAPATTGAGGSGFYKDKMAVAKKKVVSNERGLQSLRGFFKGVADSSSGESSKNSGDFSNSNSNSNSRISNTVGTSNSNKVSGSDGAPKEERVPFAPRDVNRGQQLALPKQEVVEEKAVLSKFFARSKSTLPPPHESRAPVPAVSPDANLDHAYLHLGGQLTPPLPKQDPNDSGYWDDECDDLHSFVKSSSPPRASSAAPESQPLVMDTQELWQTQIEESRGESSVVATQLVQSSSSSGAVVVVPQTPSRGRKRIHSGTMTDAGLSSPESAMGSGFISSPASSTVRGGDGDGPSGDRAADGVESDPLVADEDDRVEPEPMTPLAMRNGARRPMLHTSASMSKLEAFRYSPWTPQAQQQQADKHEAQRATLPRRTTHTTTGADGLSPSVVKSRAPVAKSRPNKLLKRSPTLVLGEEEQDKSPAGGLFERFRYAESGVERARR